MTGPSRRNFATPVLYVFVFATTASAECASVLWYRVTDYSDDEATEAKVDAEKHLPRLSPAEECHRSV